VDGHRLGIDIGASFVKLALLDGAPDPDHRAYVAHRGDPLSALAGALADLPGVPAHLGLTGAGAALAAERLGVAPVPSVQAEARAVAARFPGARTILSVGAGSSSIIHLDEHGRFARYATNALCAAGTGGFLDEQARRLGIDYAAAASVAFDEHPPSIASRCAVFAKSDLIHRQQEGHSREAMWAGLCKGCVDTFLQTLLRGRPLSGLTVVTGGITRNALVMEWLRRSTDAEIVTWPDAHLAGAIGAAHLSNGVAVPPAALRERLRSRPGERKAVIPRAAPLVLTKTKYPSFAVREERVDALGNEIRVHADLPAGDVPAWLGIDIGSTSTKLVLLGADRSVLVDVYRKTAGDPLAAARALFLAVADVADRAGASVRVLGCGTTGSGRKFIGKIVGADRIVNEISAHVAGAMRVDPSIDTIFEIGGQDSKYMRTVGGRIRDAAMNFICAAGTGSFVEEQAGKLGMKVSEIGDRVLSIAPPQTSDRCTVFMEEDVGRLLRGGATPTEAIAGVLNSVVKNYLSKVVGNRPVSRTKVFFQGATARNPGLVAAFENALGVEVVVSPLCHQMGSYGVALIVADAMERAGRASSFRGFDLARRAVDLSRETCPACVNRCAITVAAIEGTDARPSWGYLCGKEPDEPKKRVNHAFRLFRERERLFAAPLADQPVPRDAPRVALPAGLAGFSLLPFWTALVNALGLRMEAPVATDAWIKALGLQNISGDFCFPVKVALGHALAAATDGDAPVLLPHVISAAPTPHTTNSLYCPYVQSFPSVARSAMEAAGLDVARLVTPVLDLRWDDRRLIDELTGSVGRRFGATRKAMKRALAAARAAQGAFESACAAAGRKALAEIAATGEKAIVVSGRPYVCFDTGANIRLPEKIAEHGLTVIPGDFLPFDPASLGETFGNIYWNTGQRIVAAARTVAATPGLFLVQLTNFSCGPDSFLLGYTERVMGDKPLLVLELDEHGADAGYLTRVEAFLDVVEAFDERPAPRTFAARPFTADDLRRRTLWIPPMHPYAGTLAAAVFHRFGLRAEPLPPEDREAFEIGRRVVRGSECLPTSVTIGALLKKLREIDAKPSEHAFFMATASGPCRFGQYALLHRMILDEQGYADVPILSPSSTNSYQGLPEKLRRQLWWAFVAADVLMKMRCKVRPYETNPGETDAAIARASARIARALEAGRDLDDAVRASARELSAVPRDRSPRPLVGIVGEIYVRCNPFSNGDVIGAVERHGGEAWLAPLAEWFLYTAYLQRWSARQKIRNVGARGLSVLKNHYLTSAEHDVYRWASPLLDDRREPPIAEVVEAGRRFLPINFEGEAILTLGRAIAFARQGASLVVNCAPFGCMPGTITGALFAPVQQETGVPIVGMMYDGEGDVNRPIEVYLREAKAARGAAR
jgi:predicted CoA-substrate-specific enzyme activase